MKCVFQGVVDVTPTKYVYTTKGQAVAACKRLFNKFRKQGLYSWVESFEEARKEDSEGFALVYIERLTIR